MSVRNVIIGVVTSVIVTIINVINVKIFENAKSISEYEQKLRKVCLIGFLLCLVIFLVVLLICLKESNLFKNQQALLNINQEIHYEPLTPEPITIMRVANTA